MKKVAGEGPSFDLCAPMLPHREAMTFKSVAFRGKRYDISLTRSADRRRTFPQGPWDVLRKSEQVPPDFELSDLDTISVPARTLTIPTDGVGSLKRMWLIFEIEVDGTPPGFTYSHGEKLKVGL